MVSKVKLSSKHALPFRSANKERRHVFHVKQKKARDAVRRDEKFRRKREEDKNPRLRAERLAKNIPLTIDSKRKWDDTVDEDNILGVSMDLAQIKRRKLELEQQEQKQPQETTDSPPSSDNVSEDGESESGEDELDSMLDSDSDPESEDGDNIEGSTRAQSLLKPPESPEDKTAPELPSTKLDLAPEFFATKFPAIFNPPAEPKVLITTCLNSTLHAQASLLTTLIPNSSYVRRSAHRYAHKYSVREIAKFASNRGFTSLLVLNEDQKRPSGLTIVSLPEGPTFHFSISNWIEGKKIPGHGNPTNHHPELILNNFKTPLGLLTAHLFKTLFPQQPEFHGRQVITLHNQRDYIFVRRHRYVFRDKRPSEKSVVGPDGKPVQGVEDIRAGLQELGPRFTLKLRRVDKGIQRRSGQEWEWKAHTEKDRTRFQL